ncbi:MAG: ATP-binding protein [Pseudomonadota bacterium]
MRLRSLLRVTCALLLAAAGLACGTAQAAERCAAIRLLPQVLRIVTPDAGEAADAVKPPAATPQPVSVPDHLPLALRDERVRISYEIDATECAGAPAAALWVFRVGAPYRIEAQGVPLTLLSASDLAKTHVSQSVPRGESGGVYNGRIPALFALPPGARKLRIELQTLPYLSSGVVQLALGPTNLMLPVHTDAVRSVVGYADAASGVVLVIGLMALLLWLPRWRDLSLLWLATACGLWGVRGLIYFDNTVPGHPLLFEQLNAVNALLAATTIVAAVLHLIRPVSRRHVRMMLAATALSLLAFPLAELAGQGALLARSLAQLTGTAIICWLGVQIWQRRHAMPLRHFTAFTFCLLVLMTAVGHDLLVVGGMLPPTSDAFVFWGFVVVLTGFALMSGEYVVMTLNRAERSNEELELRVAQKSSALELSYQQLRSSEQEAARAHERERLLRDMHDGMGAQLMTALRGVERGALTPQQLAQSLQDGLDELRMLMDSTDMGHYLPGALATWRNRWDARLAAAGVHLEWRIDDSLDRITLPSEVAMQIMRILQEAATNIVKHSHAQSMTLDASVRDGQLHIEVTDDGVGLPPEAVRPGARGLKNMHYRAQEIGARLDITSRVPPARGSCVRLVVPLQK